MARHFLLVFVFAGTAALACQDGLLKVPSYRFYKDDFCNLNVAACLQAFGESATESIKSDFEVLVLKPLEPFGLKGWPFHVVIRFEGHLYDFDELGNLTRLGLDVPFLNPGARLQIYTLSFEEFMGSLLATANSAQKAAHALHILAENHRPVSMNWARLLEVRP